MSNFKTAKELANAGDLGMTHPTDEERQLEGIAANIVHQVGDVLYDALPADVAHEHFVTARQATNEIAIDFAKELIAIHMERAVREAEQRGYKDALYHVGYGISPIGKLVSVENRLAQLSAEQEGE